RNEIAHEVVLEFGIARLEPWFRYDLGSVWGIARVSRVQPFAGIPVSERSKRSGVSCIMFATATVSNAGRNKVRKFGQEKTRFSIDLDLIKALYDVTHERAPRPRPRCGAKRLEDQQGSHLVGVFCAWIHFRRVENESRLGDGWESPESLCTSPR